MFPLRDKRKVVLQNPETLNFMASGPQALIAVLKITVFVRIFACQLEEKGLHA